MRYGLIILLALAISLAHSPGNAEENQGTIWQALRSGGHVVLVRHAIAPGTGDPPHFTLGDCGTQRNLSATGREQAERIGDLFRSHGIPAAKVYSSQWCRCLETARLLGLGPVMERPFLNSFFRRFELRESQTTMLREWLDEQDLKEPVVLVTHQVNITAFTKVYPSSGELVIVRRDAPGDYAVVGTIGTD